MFSQKHLRKETPSHWLVNSITPPELQLNPSLPHQGSAHHSKLFNLYKHKMNILIAPQKYWICWAVTLSGDWWSLKTPVSLHINTTATQCRAALSIYSVFHLFLTQAHDASHKHKSMDKQSHLSVESFRFLLGADVNHILNNWK